MQNLIPFIVLWSLLAASVIAMIVWRKMVANQEDDTIHVLQGSVAQQVTVAQARSHRQVGQNPDRGHSCVRLDPRGDLHLPEFRRDVQYSTGRVIR